ncbi:hypothetical protein E5D57_006784 [Metarhizium anisopliae]|nr:hypothetical protein E5D57_006784 [Metarhizium anisopliae]
MDKTWQKEEVNQAPSVDPTEALMWLLYGTSTTNWGLEDSVCKDGTGFVVGLSERSIRLNIGTLWRNAVW